MNYCVAVPPNVYDTLMNQFDKGEKFAYSGKKDGSNRRLTRRDGQIYVAEPGDNRLVIPFPPSNPAMIANIIIGTWRKYETN
jgi:hypothetical protein